ncbi:MAG: PD-(D/E)XK nuclease family protein [Prevotella sp.]|nr:PD-(D/E)XK nuclease family protein [Prevotella sp.]
MKIIYSPAYQGFTYYNLNASPNGVALDIQICSTSGLLDLLELYAGKHIELINSNKRTALYYSALLEYTKEHPNHLLADSFRLDGLGTAKTCLHWRDLLIEAGWTGQEASVTGRMEVLCGIENLFDCPGNGERIHDIIESVKNGCVLPPQLEIEMAIPEDCLHPSLRALFEILRQREVNIYQMNFEEIDGSNLSMVRNLVQGKKDVPTELKTSDKSFQIFKFKQRQDAVNNLTLQNPSNYDVWIDSDNKAFDNTLRLSGQPTCGSHMKDVIPQISQLLIIGLNLIPRPLNIYFLLEWLRSPVNPLDKKLREPLADMIVDSGGYYNKKCQEVIDNYRNGKYDSWPSDITEEEKKETIQRNKPNRTKLIKKFLPPMERPADVLKMDEHVKKNDVLTFVDHLSKWVKNRLHKNINQTEQLQLQVIVEQAEALTLLLSTETKEDIPVTVLQGWINSSYEPQDYPMYEAEKDCRNVIATPANMAGESDKTIWCDFYDHTNAPSSYAFLSQKEKEALAAEGVHIWAADDERRYHAFLQQIPFLLTKHQLTLVFPERDGSEVLQKHPLMILLEQHFNNLCDVVIEPQPEEKHFVDCPLVNNQPNDEQFLKIKNADHLKWRDKESATSLDLLIQHPFDYTMKYLVGIKDNSISAMKQLDITKGLVAHNTIAQLFYKEGEENTADQISKRIESSFDKSFSNALLEEGAILLLRENRVDTKILKDRLRYAIDTLLGIVRDNDLCVVECEKKIIRKLGLEYNPDIKGYIDMLLTDRQGKLYVFDFKWTSSKNHYKDLIAKNGSLQLALYKELAKKELSKPVAATAYFLMPENRLYSTHAFQGSDAIQLEETENVGKKLFTQIKNSHKYRCQQLSEGNIELGEGKDTSELRYVSDSSDKKLMPLRSRDGIKEENIFSDYNNFRK